ncbi:hypothetical protein Vafri_13896, partial [Volvox africanus]
MNTQTGPGMGRTCGLNAAAAHPHIAAAAAVADAALKRIATLPRGPIAATNCGASKGCGDSTALTTAVIAAGAAGAATHPSASTTSSTGSNSGCESEATAVSRERWQQRVASRGWPEAATAAATAAAVTEPSEQHMQVLSAVPHLSAVGACNIGGGSGAGGSGKVAPGFGPPVSVNPQPAAAGWVRWGCVDGSGGGAVPNPAAAAAATAAAASSVPNSRAQSLDGTHPTSAGGAAPLGPLPPPLHLSVPPYPGTSYRYNPYARPWGAQSFGPVAAPVPVPTPVAGAMPTVPSAAGGCVRRSRLGTYYHPAALPPPCFSGFRPLPRSAAVAAAAPPPSMRSVKWPSAPHAARCPDDSATALPGVVDDYPMDAGSNHAVYSAVCDPHPLPQHLPSVAHHFYRHGLYAQPSSACGGGGGGGASSTHALSLDGCRTDLICSGRSSAGGAEIAVGCDAATADVMAATAARCIRDGTGETDAAAPSREAYDAGAMQALVHGSPAPPVRMGPWVSRLPSSGGSAAAAAAAAGDIPRNLTSQHPQFNSLRTAPAATPAPVPVPVPVPAPVGAQHSALDAQLWWTSCRHTQYGLANFDAA